MVSKSFISAMAVFCFVNTASASHVYFEVACTGESQGQKVKISGGRKISALTEARSTTTVALQGTQMYAPYLSEPTAKLQLKVSNEQKMSAQTTCEGLVATVVSKFNLDTVAESSAAQIQKGDHVFF